MPKYYVYHLIDPCTNTPFYVGKGMGNRVSWHVKQAVSGAVGVKADKIRAVILTGDAVVEKVVRRFASENDAYAFEKKEITRIGLSNLTNIAPGGRSIRSDEVLRRASARATLKAIQRMLGVIAAHDEVGFWYCGKFFDVSVDDIKTMIKAGMAQAVEILGVSEVSKLQSDWLESCPA